MVLDSGIAPSQHRANRTRTRNCRCHHGRARVRARHHIRHPIRAVGGDLQAETRREMKGCLRRAPAGHRLTVAKCCA